MNFTEIERILSLVPRKCSEKVPLLFFYHRLQLLNSIGSQNILGNLALRQDGFLKYHPSYLPTPSEKSFAFVYGFIGSYTYTNYNVPITRSLGGLFFKLHI